MNEKHNPWVVTIVGGIVCGVVVGIVMLYLAPALQGWFPPQRPTPPKSPVVEDTNGDPHSSVAQSSSQNKPALTEPPNNPEQPHQRTPTPVTQQTNENAVVVATQTAEADLSPELADSALNQAIYANDPVKLRSALSAGANPNYFDVNGTALHQAVQKGSVEMVSILISHGAEVDAEHPSDENDVGDTSLIKAIKYRMIDVMAKLLAQGADPNKANRMGVTPLMWAAINGDLEAVNLLLAAGANPKPSPGGNSAYRYAVMHGHHSVAQRLAEVGGEPQDHLLLPP